MSLDERLDLFAIRAQVERLSELAGLGSLAADVGFLRRARRSLLPLPLIDRPREINASDVFPPFEPRPVSLIGVARAFEEAGLEPAEIVSCSGGAIWGSMWAAGMTAQEMAEFSLSWQPEEYLDIQWLKLPRFALSALRGFTGIAKGEAIERLFARRLHEMRCGETPIPITTIVYNMDLGTVEYFGTKRTPDVPVGHLVRVAIALPLFIESVEVHGHLYVDGGVIEVWPARPVVEDGSFDRVFGVNFKLTLIDPVDASALRGTSFYELFIDRVHWPELIRQGHDAATRALNAFRTPVPDHSDPSEL
jgi:NTE family protein